MRDATESLAVAHKLPEASTNFTVTMYLTLGSDIVIEQVLQQ